MTNEELLNQIDVRMDGLDGFILGLKQEVLEIKEVLNDDYLKKDVILNTFLGKHALDNYITEIEIGGKYETIEHSMSTYDELLDKFNGYAKVRDLRDYTRLGDFNTKINEIESKLNDVNRISSKIETLEAITDTIFAQSDGDDNNDQFSLFYTKDESNSLFATKDEIPSTIGFAKSEYVINNFVKKKDLDSLINEKSYLKSDIDTKFITSEDANVVFDNINETLATLVSSTEFNEYKTNLNRSISNFVTRDWLVDRFENRFATLSLLDDYVTNFEFNDKIGEQNAKNDTFATKEELENYVTNARLGSLMTTFVSRLDVEDIVANRLGEYQQDLNGYVMTYDFNNEINNAKNRLRSLESRMADVVTDSNFDEHTSNLVKKNDLFNYVKKSDLTEYIGSLSGNNEAPNLTNFITFDEASSFFVSKSEIHSYIPNISGYASTESIDVLNDRIDGLNMSLVENMSKITTLTDNLEVDYYTKTDIDAKLSEFVPSDEQLKQYIKKSEVRNYIGLDTYKFASKKELYDVYLKLNDYVKYTDTALMRDYVNTTDYQNDRNELYSYINEQVTAASKGGKLVTIDDVEGLLDDKLTKYMTERKLEEKIVKLCTPTRIKKYVEECVSEDFVNDAKSYIDTQMKDYLKPEDKDEIIAYIDNKVVDSRIDADVLGARLNTFVTSDEMRRQMSEYFSEVNYKRVIEETITNKTIQIIESLLDSKMQTNYLTPNDKDAMYEYVNNKIGGIDYVDSETLRNTLSNYATERDIRRMIADSFSDSNIDRIIGNLLTERVNKILDNMIENKMATYLTESKANTKYLQLEDYKNLKNCAIMSDYYKDKPEEFFAKVIDANGAELDRSKDENPLRNGFYIVERNVYLVFDGTVVELDRLEYNWKIEED